MPVFHAFAAWGKKYMFTSSKYKFDMQVDCFNMANKHFDAARSKAEKKLSFITTSIELVDERIQELNKESEIPIYNLLPGDVLAYLFAVEKEFDIQVPSSYILEGKFNTLNNVTDIVCEVLPKKL